MDPLYEMKLGDCLYDSKCHRNYVRVPGGWVVESGNDTDVTASCFVPFHNEFMECSEKGEPSFNSPASPVQQAQPAITILRRLVAHAETGVSLDSDHPIIHDALRVLQQQASAPDRWDNFVFYSSCVF